MKLVKNIIIKRANQLSFIILDKKIRVSDNKIILNKLSINDKINIRIGSVQMKKKGFTLIELLAVIVILAIIALIATPLVLKYIEKAREEAAIASAYAYIDAYEKNAAQ